jgi:hypothetical protein
MYHLTVKTSTIITKFSTNEGNGGEMNILKKFFENNQKTLENIDLTGNHTLVGKNLKGLFFVSSILQELSLKGCFNIENLTIIEIFQQCKQIKCLDLNSCHQINDQVIFFLATNLLFLKELNLGSCLKITDMAIKSLCQYLPLLEKLNCSQNTRLTDLAIDQIVSSLFFLKELRVWGCTKLTWTSIYALSIGLPCLTLIDIRSRDKIEIMIGGQKALNFFLYRSSTMKSTSLCSYKWEQAEQLGVFKRTIPCSVVPAVWS